jgi:hypothetical protein
MLILKIITMKIIKLNCLLIALGLISMEVIAQTQTTTPKSTSPSTNRQDRSTGNTGMDRKSVDNLIDSWPETSKRAAREMMDKYGQPNESTQSLLIWNNNGPWKRTIVYKEEVRHLFPMPHMDVVEQVLDYKVPAEMVDEITMYDGSVVFKRTNGEIAARCDREMANMLALNLANDVATGKRTSEDARKFYAETMMQAMNGQASDYTQKLTFNPGRNTADPDQAVMDMKDMKGMMDRMMDDNKGGKK